MASRVESISAESAASIPETSDPEELDLIAGGIVVDLATEGGTSLGTLKIDDFESELLQKAAVRSGLSLTELLSFIVFRQLEAFYPPGIKGIYRVSGDAVDEVSNGLAVPIEIRVPFGPCPVPLLREWVATRIARPQCAARLLLN